MFFYFVNDIPFPSVELVHVSNVIMQYSPGTKRGAERSNLVSEYTVPFPIHYILLTSLCTEDVAIFWGSWSSDKVWRCLQVPVCHLSHQALENRVSLCVAKAQFVRITQLRGLHLPLPKPLLNTNPLSFSSSYKSADFYLDSKISWDPYFLWLQIRGNSHSIFKRMAGLISWKCDVVLRFYPFPDTI